MFDAVFGAIANLQGTDLLVALFLASIMVVLRLPENKMIKKTRALTAKWLIMAMAGSMVMSFILRIIDLKIINL